MLWERYYLMSDQVDNRFTDDSVLTINQFYHGVCNSYSSILYVDVNRVTFNQSNMEIICYSFKYVLRALCNFCSWCIFIVFTMLCVILAGSVACFKGLLHVKAIVMGLCDTPQTLCDTPQTLCDTPQTHYKCLHM